MLCSSTKQSHWVPYILPNRGQNKDTICFLLLLVLCMNCSGSSPISSCSVSSTGWLVLALYHNLSPVTIFPSLCYKIVQGLSGTGRMFSWREFPTTGFQLSTKLQATVMRRGRRGAAANWKIILALIELGWSCLSCMRVSLCTKLKTKLLDLLIGLENAQNPRIFCSCGPNITKETVQTKEEKNIVWKDWAYLCNDSFFYEIENCLPFSDALFEVTKR